MPQLSACLNRRPSHRAVRRAIATGDLVALSAGKATRYQARVASSLADLVKWAEAEVDGTLAPPGPGRRGGSSRSRAIHALSPRQMSRIRQAASRIAAHVAPGLTTEDGLRAVGTDTLVWDPVGGPGGLGGWTRMEELTRSACMGVSRNTASGYVGAMVCLLDLAATRGWIRGAEPHRDDFDPITPEWVATWDTWREALLSSGSKKHEVSTGLLWLLRGLTEVGANPDSLDEATWEAAIGRLEDMMEGASLATSVRYGIRRSYQALRAAGGVNGPEWRQPRAQSTQVLPRQWLAGLARAYGRERTWARTRQERHDIWSGLPDEVAGLRDGTWGLPALVDHLTAPVSVAGGVVPRDVSLTQTPPMRSSSPWSGGTLHSRIEALGMWLGLWRQEFGTDWRTADLRALCDPDRVEKLTVRILEGEVQLPPQTLHFALVALGRIASMVAWLARRSQDSDLERRALGTHEVITAKQFNPQGSCAPVPGLMARIRNGKGPVEERIIARRVEAAWTSGVLHGQRFPFAYEAMNAAWRAMADAFLRGLGHTTWADLEQSVAAGHRLSRDEAGDLRDLLIFNLLQVVPLRRRALALLRVGWIEAKDNALQLHMRAYARKSRKGNDSIDIPDTDPAARWDVFHLHSGGPSEIFCRGALAVYLQKGGARDVLAAGLPFNDSPYLWLPETWPTTDPPSGELLEHPRVTPTNISRRIRRLRLRAASLMGISRSKLVGLRPLHSMRHSFGTFFVRTGHARLAQLYLGHRSMDLLMLIYADEDARHFHPGTEAGRLLSERATP